MTIKKLIGVIFFLFTLAFCQDLQSLNPSIAFVSSGVFWKSNDVYGTCKVIVINEGFEHVRSRVYLQWIQSDAKTHSQVVKKTLEMDSLSTGEWLVKQPSFETKNNSLNLKVDGVNILTEEKKQWYIKITGVGKYSIKSK